jgi:hypothetical protein
LTTFSALSPAGEPGAGEYRFPTSAKGINRMVIGIAHLQPIVALVAGIAILLVPRLLNYIVAAYLIFIGIVGLGLLPLH